jgi:hypothetical protein
MVDDQNSNIDNRRIFEPGHYRKYVIQPIDREIVLSNVACIYAMRK